MSALYSATISRAKFVLSLFALWLPLGRGKKPARRLYGAGSYGSGYYGRI